jgi:hypothetical protein
MSNALIERSKRIVANFATQAARLDQLAHDSSDPERAYYLREAKRVRYMIDNEGIRLKGLERITG